MNLTHMYRGLLKRGLSCPQAQQVGKTLPSLPQYGSYTILPPSGQCLWGTVGKLMALAMDKQPEVQHFAMLTSSLRGPFLQAFSQVNPLKQSYRNQVDICGPFRNRLGA